MAATISQPDPLPCLVKICRLRARPRVLLALTQFCWVQRILYRKIARIKDENYTQRLENHSRQNHLASWHQTCSILIQRS